jgi:hypothetical protein
MKQLKPVLATVACVLSSSMSLARADAPASSLVEFEGQLISSPECCAQLPVVEHDHLWCVNFNTSCGSVTVQAPASVAGTSTLKFPDGSTAPVASDDVAARFAKENAAINKNANLPAPGDSCMTDYLIRRAQLVKHAAWAPKSGIELVLVGGIAGAAADSAKTLVPIVENGISLIGDLTNGSQAAGTAAQTAENVITADAALLPPELITGAAIGGAVAFTAYAAWQTDLIIQVVELDHVIDILREARAGSGKHLAELVRRLNKKGILQASGAKGAESVALTLIEADDQGNGYAPVSTVHGQLVDANGELGGSVKVTLPCSEKDTLAGGCNTATSEEAVLARAIESLDRRHALCDGVLSRPTKKPSKNVAGNLLATEGRIAKILKRYARYVDPAKGVVATVQAPIEGYRGYSDDGVNRALHGVLFPGGDGTAKDGTVMMLKLSGNVLDFSSLR